MKLFNYEQFFETQLCIICKNVPAIKMHKIIINKKGLKIPAFLDMYKVKSPCFQTVHKLSFPLCKSCPQKSLPEARPPICIRYIFITVVDLKNS